MALKYKLIYNPHAGLKRRLMIKKSPLSVGLLRYLCKRYELEVDFFPTAYPHHATLLAKEAQKEGYDVVIAAGGDGTVGEVANGLVGSDIPLGILPFGTFMNVANMLSISFDLDEAMLLIKVGKTRKIDVGQVSRLDGEKPDGNYYFLESAGVGIDAQIQKFLLLWERKKYYQMIGDITTLFKMYRRPITIEIDGKKMVVKASLINIANGPLYGAGLEIAPESKMNDHQLTVSLFRMNRREFLRYFIFTAKKKKYHLQNIETFHSSKVLISCDDERPVHIDARWFGTVPAAFKIIPSALTVIIGFPEDKSEAGLKEDTYLEP